MYLSRRVISRRTLLRGAGAAVALPLLDAMVPAATPLAQTAAAPLRQSRLTYVYIPMGYNPAEWTPTGETLGTLPSSLEPLEPVKQRVNIVSRMELRNAYPGSHATSNAAFLSAARAKRTESSDYYLGATADQIAAQVFGGQTQLPSLELAMDLQTNVGQCDNGYACIYQNCLAWSSPTTPLPAEAHPRAVFEMLFGQGGTPSDRRAALAERASLLDAVQGEMRRLRAQLGPHDCRTLDEYLTSIRDVERRLQLAEATIDEHPLPDLERPSGVPLAYADHARLMFELQRLAFQGNITRVVTFQLAREESTRTYPEIGVPEPHHPTTHHGRNPEKLAKIAKINRFHVSLLAEHLQRMSEIADGDGSLLDHSLTLYGSGMGDPDAHDHSNLPIIVAGGAGLGVRGGQHIVCREGEPLANLHVTLLNKAGISLETFADSDGRIAALNEPVTL